MMVKGIFAWRLDHQVPETGTADGLSDMAFSQVLNFSAGWFEFRQRGVFQLSLGVSLALNSLALCAST